MAAPTPVFAAEDVFGVPLTEFGSVEPHRVERAKFQAETEERRANQQPCMRRSRQKFVNSDPP